MTPSEKQTRATDSSKTAKQVHHIRGWEDLDWPALGLLAFRDAGLDASSEADRGVYRH
jgi:hypothetical protein